MICSKCSSAGARHQASDLVDKLGCDGDKIVIAGNPRFDLHRPELRGVFRGEREPDQARARAVHPHQHEVLAI